jgi:hypothetical protein
MTPLDDEKDEKALGRTLLWALKHPMLWIPLLGGTAAWGWLRPTTPQPEDVFWTKTELRQLMREEVRPLEAGITALAERQDDRTQVAVLKAMAKARKTIREDE